MTLNLPKVSFGACSNIFIKMMHFKNKGECECGHKHTYDHISLLAKGSVVVTVNGQETTFTAPHMIYISKDYDHEIVALEDNTLWFCIHALRKGDGTGDIISEDMIPAGVSNAIALTSQLALENKIERNMVDRSSLTSEDLEHLKDLEERDFIGSISGDIPSSLPKA